jgi:hypothetical protein
MKNDKTLKERVLHECPVEEEKGVFSGIPSLFET